MDAGEPFTTSYPEFPVQVWKLGREHIWVSLGGETVSGYSVAIRREISPLAAVFGYTNDVMAYIPTPEIIEQGQYIGESSMAVYGLPTMRWMNHTATAETTAAMTKAMKYLRRFGSYWATIRNASTAT